MHFDPKTARGSVDCGRCLRARFRYMGEVCTLVLFIELERVITESESYGPVVIAGDFNAHLGTQGGERASDNLNPQGALLKQLVDRCELHVASLSASATGPLYTFESGDSQTTVDYIITNFEASHLVQSCATLDPSPLNCSDHLPVSVTLKFQSTLLARESSIPRINWEKAKASNLMHDFQNEVSNIVSPLIGSTYDSIDQLNEEIAHVSELIKQAALSTLPHCKPRTQKRKWFIDQTLALLASLKKRA